MLNKSAYILKETFSIENVSFGSQGENVFLEIFEGKHICRVSSGGGPYRCLQVNTIYNPTETGILQKISRVFSDSQISIFAFTSINHGYLFYEEKFQNEVENNILTAI